MYKLENTNIKLEEEIEKNKRGIYDVRPLQKNAKVLDLNNLGETILNLESVTKQALIRLFSNNLTYYLNQMEKNNELQTTKITSLNVQGGDKVYFYEEFSKESQAKSELISYFIYFLNESGFKYGKLTVNPSDKSLSVPFLIETETGTLKFETEVIPLQSYELNTFNFERNFTKLPVFVVNELYSLEFLLQKEIHCILIYVDTTGRKTTVRGIYKEPNTKDEKGKTLLLKPEYIKKYSGKYVTQINDKYTIDNFKQPYLEAENRSINVKSRINSKKSL